MSATNQVTLSKIDVKIESPSKTDVADASKSAVDSAAGAKSKKDQHVADDRSTGSVVAAILLAILAGMLVTVLAGGYLANEHEATIAQQSSRISVLSDRLDYCNNITSMEFAIEAETEILSLSNELRHCRSGRTYTPPHENLNLPEELDYVSLCMFWSLVVACVVFIVVTSLCTCVKANFAATYHEQWTKYRKQSFASLVGFYGNKKYTKRIRGKQYLEWVTNLSSDELQALNSTLSVCSGTRLPAYLFEDSAAAETQSTMQEIWDAYSSDTIPWRTLITLQFALFQMAESGLISD